MLEGTVTPPEALARWGREVVARKKEESRTRAIAAADARPRTVRLTELRLPDLSP